MKKGLLSLMNLFGLLIVVAYMLIDYFVVKIPDNISIPILLVGIALIIAGNFYNRKNMRNNRK